MGEDAAVDDEVGARDPARGGGGEEERGVGDVGRLSEPPERRRRVPARDALGQASSSPSTSIRPGETQLTRTPFGPSSSAAARVCMITAAFAAA